MSLKIIKIEIHILKNKMYFLTIKNLNIITFFKTKKMPKKKISKMYFLKNKKLKLLTIFLVFII